MSASAGDGTGGADQPTPSFDYYDFLDVDPDATRAEIKTAYKRLTRDSLGADRRPLAEAYEVLTDPGRRAEYDRIHSTITRRLPKPGRRPAPLDDADEAIGIDIVDRVDSGGDGADLDDGGRSPATAGRPPSRWSRRGTDRPAPADETADEDAPPSVNWAKSRPAKGDRIAENALAGRGKDNSKVPTGTGSAPPPKPSAMQDDEVKLVYLLAVAQALAAVVITAALHNRAEIWRFFAINLVLAVAIAASARLANRFLALIAALAGGLFGLYPISVLLAAPHYGLAIWIMLRQNRAARVHGEWRRQERSGAPPRSGARATGGRASARRPPDEDRPTTPAQRRREKSEAAGRGAPRPSKRYTPPKTKTKRR